MSGFVGSRAKKRQRNIFFILTFIIFFAILIRILPAFKNSNNQVIPNDNIMPDPSEDLTSLTSKTEELELSLFQKDQKIKFRDDQIKNLQSEFKSIQSQYDSVILELNNIKNSSDDEDLISANKYKSLQEDLTKFNIQNDKNILLIKSLNKQIDDLNNYILLKDEKIKNIILDNKKLTKDSKSFFAKNIKLESVIKDLIKSINYQKNEINLQLKEINKLKDRSHHGG